MVITLATTSSSDLVLDSHINENSSFKDVEKKTQVIANKAFSDLDEGDQKEKKRGFLKKIYRFVFRPLERSVRAIKKHPKKVLIIAVVLLIIIAMIILASKRDNEEEEIDFSDIKDRVADKLGQKNKEQESSEDKNETFIEKTVGSIGKDLNKIAEKSGFDNPSRKEYKEISDFLVKKMIDENPNIPSCRKVEMKQVINSLVNESSLGPKEMLEFWKEELQKEKEQAKNNFIGEKFSPYGEVNDQLEKLNNAKKIAEKEQNLTEAYEIAGESLPEKSTWSNMEDHLYNIYISTARRMLEEERKKQAREGQTEGTQ